MSETTGSPAPGAAPDGAEMPRDSEALRLSSISIRRMPGIPDPFTIPELSPGVTVVFGPNGSGKSTTARAIEAALWPARAAQASVAVMAEYEMGGSRYRVEVDSGHVAVQVDGSNGRAPDLPAPELLHRYRLSLHELMASDDGDFAREIARQSAGGYDLGAAAESLELRGQPFQARNENAALVRALEAERAARLAQRSLGERASGLDALRARRDSARAARERQQLLTLAVKHAKAAAEAERARSEVAAFPGELATMSGSEYESLDALRRRERECRDLIEEARRGEGEALAAAESIFPGAAPDVATMAALRSRLEELREAQRIEADCARAVAGCDARRAAAWRTLGADDAAGEARLANVDAGNFHELAEHGREAERAHAELDAADAAARSLADARTPEDLFALRSGADLLSLWLSESARSDGEAVLRRGAFLWGAALLAAAGWLLHALRWHWAFGALALLALAIAALGSLAASRRDPRAGLRLKYERLGFEQPKQWTRDLVRELHDRLLKRLAEGNVSARRVVLREQAEEARARAEERARAVDARGVELAKRLGVAPDTDQRQLSWLAERIGQWQNAVLDANAAHAAHESARIRLGESLSAAAEVVRRYGYDDLASVASIAGAIDALERSAGEHAAALARAAEAGRSIAANERARAALARDCHALLVRVGVDSDDQVERLCASFEAYRAACENERFALQALENLRGELRALAGYDAELEVGSVRALERACDEAAAAASELDELTAEVARVEQEVERAKQANDLENAVAATASARAALLTQREADLRSMVGAMISRHVQRRARDQHRPEVFRRAGTLFTRVTRGRYELRLEEGDTAPTFRAFDTVAGMGRALEELSSATRVQLMLAVRVAFVESQERRTALPLLLDETLGTSDDARAGAIIDAVMLLAGAGRQIFYFTAQQDEARKWIAALDERRVPYTIVDLARVRGQRASLAPMPLPLASVPLAEIPEPRGCSHGEYGDMLRVPAFRPGVDAADSAPLWYVIEDADELCRMMRSGVGSWGELRNLVENGASRLVADRPDLWSRARACAAALDALTHEAGIGLGRPVDRSVLASSGAVSDIQMPRVLEQCERCGGDARALVEGLENGAVSGFQSRKTEVLRSYLEENGYLDPRPKRDAAQLRAAMQRAIAPAVAEGTLAPSAIDSLLRRLESRRSAVVAGPTALSELDAASDDADGAHAESRSARSSDG